MGSYKSISTPFGVLLSFVMLLPLLTYSGNASSGNLDAKALSTIFTLSKLHETLAQRCAGSNKAVMRDYQQWLETNQIDQIMAAIRRDFAKGIDRKMQPVLAKMQAAVDHLSRKKACRRLSTSINESETAFLQRFPKTYAHFRIGQGKQRSRIATANPPQPVKPIQQSPQQARQIKQRLGKIKRVGMDISYSFGMGGMVTANPEPVILFKDGRACSRMDALAYRQGLAAHQRKYPKAWTRWRRKAGQYQLKGNKGWRKIAYDESYLPLPKGTRIQGSYLNLSGGGNKALGGNAFIASQSNYHFNPDGRFSVGKTNYASNRQGGTRVTAGGRAKSLYGTYQIQGYSLLLRFADGRQVQHSLVADPKNLKAIWIDGRGYSKSG